MASSREQLMSGIDDLVRGVFGPHLRRRHRLADLDLTMGQMECLRLISQLGSPSMSELAAHLDLRPSTITGLVDGLVQRGKVERCEDAADRRIVRARLTEQGRCERDQHHRCRRRELLGLLGDLADDDLRKLHEALSVLHAAAARRAEAAVAGAAGEAGR